MVKGQPRSGPRMTPATQAVLRALLDEPTQERYGLELSEAANLETGTIHPILARLEKLGWVDSKWEELDPKEAGRPRRRYYRLTPDGAELACDALAHSSSHEQPFVRLRPGLTGETQ